MSMRFRKAYNRVVLPRDAAVRQGRAVNAALAALGSDDALVFLNTHHPGLGGRPLDLAVASDVGLGAVETALGDEARRGAQNS